MTGDWTGFLPILRLVQGSEVPVVVLNDIQLIVKVIDNVDSLLPGKTDGTCNKRYSPAPCRLEIIMMELYYYKT